MGYLGKQVTNDARVRVLSVAILMLGCALGSGTQAGAQRISTPPTPRLITPPAGNSGFLWGHGVGTQGYVCLPKGRGTSWAVNNARPEATLFSVSRGREVQIITHFQSPDTNPNAAAPTPIPFGSATWQSSSDSSVVWAQVRHANTIPAGSDPSCPHTGSIACLLLQSIGSKNGPAGGGFMTQITFIQRLNTNGGSAPADSDGCADPSDVGNQRLVPYSADYYFFHANDQATSLQTQNKENQ
jgi:hypothetical protein